METASLRAQICELCPKNTPETLWEKPKGLLARAARRAFAWKANRNLKLSTDELLGVCEACGCDLKLKVWAPVDVTGKTDKSDLHSMCWILKEERA